MFGAVAARIYIEDGRGMKSDVVTLIRALVRVDGNIVTENFRREFLGGGGVGDPIHYKKFSPWSWDEPDDIYGCIRHHRGSSFAVV